MRVTRFNPLWVSGDTQGVYCFCFSFISYWRNDFFSQCTFYIYHENSIQWWKLENQLVKLVNINYFKNNNFRIEIGTAVAPLLKADKESGIVVFNGMFWSENQSDCCDRSIFGNPGTVVATKVIKHGRKRFLTAPGFQNSGQIILDIQIENRAFVM